MAVSADLGKPIEDYLEELVKSGRYRSRSEVLREGVRLVQEREAKIAGIRMKIDEGIAAVDRGDSRPAEDVFAEPRAHILGYEGNGPACGLRYPALPKTTFRRSAPSSLSTTRTAPSQTLQKSKRPGY